MRAFALLASSLGALCVACGPKPLPPPPSPPRAASAAELIPADLDVVVRVDLARVKSSIGAVGLSVLAGRALAHGDPATPVGTGSSADQLLVSSLLEADTVYLGYRPSAAFVPLDRVLAVQGRFTPLNGPPTGFSRAIDLGGDVRYWDARQPPTREGVARIYVIADRLRAFVSEAELDSVERSLTGAISPRRLEPPEEGTLSLAARPALLGRLAGRGRLRELLEGGKALRAVLDLESHGLRAKAELTLESPEEARELAGAAELVLARALGASSDHTKLTIEGERVLLSAELGREQLSPVLGCLGLGAGEAPCPW
jgi:hypothetical protein